MYIFTNKKGRRLNENATVALLTPVYKALLEGKPRISRYDKHHKVNTAIILQKQIISDSFA